MKTGKQPLEDQVAALRAEIDLFIDARVETIRKTCEGVPAPVIRNLLTAKSEGCLCQTLLNIAAEDRKAEAA